MNERRESADYESHTFSMVEDERKRGRLEARFLVYLGRVLLSYWTLLCKNCVVSQRRDEDELPFTVSTKFICFDACIVQTLLSVAV